MPFSAAAEVCNFLNFCFLFASKVFSADAVSIRVLMYYVNFFCGNFLQRSSDFCQH